MIENQIFNQFFLTVCPAGCLNATLVRYTHAVLSEDSMNRLRTFARPRVTYAAIGVLCMLLALPLNAQNAQGTILGHVTDQSGAVVSGATVRITNVATSVTRVVKTNTAGDYVFVNIIPGNYDITIEAPGFSTRKAVAQRLEVDATLRQDFKLQVGAASQEVTVTSQYDMVQTDNVTSGEVIPSKLIDELPIAGRDFNNLLRIQAGATQEQGGSQSYWGQHGLNNDFTPVSING